jgi:hypothetical protein
MTGWRRQRDAPAKPLTEDRKRLVRSYMDAEEAEARREAIDELERQSRIREQARREAEAGAKQHVEAAAAAGGIGAEDTVPQSNVRVEAVRREAAEETARQVATAVEQARREADEEAARQVAAAVEQARREADEEARHRIAAAAQQERAQARDRAAEEATHLEAVAVKRAREQGRQKAAERVVRGGAGAAEQPPRETAEEAPRQVVAAAEDRARDNSTEGLPVYEWVQAATQQVDASEPADWTRDLLRKRGKADTS